MKTVISLLFAFVFVGIADVSETVTDTDKNIVNDNVIESVSEWNVPFDDSRSRDPFVAPNGTVYFAGQRGDYIGHFNPDTEEFREYPLEDGAGPHTVVVTDDGTVWYTGNRARHIGKMDPETGEITKYMMENEHARDPHTFAIDKNGNLWFTSQGGNGVGHFNVETGESRVIPVPTERARPYGIRMANDGMRPWISLFGTNKLATVDPETMELTEIELPRDEIRPRRLDITSDGNIWYGDYAMGKIGRYNPDDGSIKEWDIPEGEGSRPYAVLADHKDRIWLGLSGPDPSIMAAFDTESEEFVASQVIESGDGSIRHMDFDKNTRSLWFGTDTGHIGRIIVN